LRPVELVEQVLPGAVAVTVTVLPNSTRAGVGGEVLAGVEVLGNLDRLGAHVEPVVAAVGMVLEVGQVRPLALQDLHGFQRGRVIARRAQVIAVQVQRVRQTQLVDDCGKGLDDLGRG